MIELVLALQLLTQCSPNVDPTTMSALVRVESANNPYAIGVVGGALRRQPRSKAEAVATAQELERQGKNFSMGLAQINRHNLPRYDLSYSDVFEPCANLRVGGQILAECYGRALPKHPDGQTALRAALSCYYSGNFVRGFKPDKAGDPSYVEKVVAAAGQGVSPIVVPAIQGGPVAGPAPHRPEGSVMAPLNGEGRQLEAPAAADAAAMDVEEPVRLRAVNEATAPAAPAATRTEATAVVF